MRNPKIVTYLCWCSDSGADQAGVEGIKYPAGIMPVKIPCSALLSPEVIIKAFEKGADGVIVSACKPSEMRKVAPSRMTEVHLAILRELLEEVGIEGDRLRLVWISSQEGMKFADQMKAAADRIAALGPLRNKEAERIV